MCRKRFAETKIFTTFVVPTTEQGRNIAPIIRRVKKFEGISCIRCIGTSDFFFIEIGFIFIQRCRNRAKWKPKRKIKLCDRQ